MDLESNTPGRIPRLGWVIAFLAIATAISIVYMNFRKSERTDVSKFEKLAAVPEFQFTAQNGESVNLEDLKGKIWVANFIFTRCGNPCPALTSRMSELNQALGKAGDVRLVTFSVDPEYDTPEVLAKYAERVQADPEKWLFLTGDKEKIHNFIIQGMLQPLAEEPSGLVAHSSRFVIVDREGNIRTFEEGTDREVVPKVLMNIGSLIRERPSVAPET